MKETILIQTRVAKSTGRAVKRLAEREGISVAAYVRRLIMQEVRFGGANPDGDFHDPLVRRRP